MVCHNGMVTLLTQLGACINQVGSISTLLIQVTVEHASAYSMLSPLLLRSNT